MAAKALRFKQMPDELEQLLNAHLPQSLPLLRRLQFAKYHERYSPESKVVFISPSEEIHTNVEKFTVVYMDVSGGPDTQMWLYSTLEDDEGRNAGDEEYRRQLERLVREVVQIGKEYGKPIFYPGGLLLGTINTHVRRILESMNRVRGRPTGYYDKWLFKAEDLPGKDATLPDGMHWDKQTLEDCKLVVKRTDIPRRA